MSAAQHGRPAPPPEDADAPLSPAELEELARARALLEGGGLVVRVADALGRPLEAGLERLPARAREAVRGATQTALERGLRVALGTMAEEPSRASSERLHKAAAATTGAVGGFFGLGGLTLELPVTTVVMLRSIADIARSENQDLARPETRLACLEVFALGGGGGDNAAETGYYAVRAALSQALAEAARHIAQHGLSREGAPVLVRAVAAVAARFGVVVEQKVALASVPFLGAVTASMINTLFIDHFQKRARGHFVVRRLEAIHGYETVREAYETMGRAPGAGAAR
ncbi:MAG: EcsC family protein [Acidobacteria bacterium]|nr:EcsC family protein [Acidobacteriota bacterium]